MGIHNRDYIRESPSRGGFSGGGDGTGWKRIIAITVAVFVLQMVFRQSGVIDEWLKLSPSLVIHGQIWRFVTYAFCHDIQNLLHIFFNVLWFWFLARALEQIYGTREFVLFYLAAAVFSGLLYVGLGLILDDQSAVIGASGAVMAVTMLYALHFPRQIINIWGIIPIEVRWLVLLTIVFETYSELQRLGGVDLKGHVAHSAHLGGLAFGYIYYRWQWRLEALWQRLRLDRLRRQVSSRPKVRVYQPSVEEEAGGFDAQVDAILEKISESGEASLTDQERDILKRASRRYKKK